MPSLISRYNVYENISFDIYTHVFDTFIAPVIMYDSEACCYNNFMKFDKIQRRVMRSFLEFINILLFLEFKVIRDGLPFLLIGRISMVRF